MPSSPGRCRCGGRGPVGLAGLAHLESWRQKSSRRRFCRTSPATLLLFSIGPPSIKHFIAVCLLFLTLLRFAVLIPSLEGRGRGKEDGREGGRRGGGGEKESEKKRERERGNPAPGCYLHPTPPPAPRTGGKPGSPPQGPCPPQRQHLSGEGGRAGNTGSHIWPSLPTVPFYDRGQIFQCLLCVLSYKMDKLWWPLPSPPLREVLPDLLCFPTVINLRDQI